MCLTARKDGQAIINGKELYSMPTITWAYFGDAKGYRIFLDGEEIHFTTSERERDMFIAELKGRLKFLKVEPKDSINNSGIGWVEIAKTGLPKEDGNFAIYAKAAHDNRSTSELKMMAWHSQDRGWSLMPAVWIPHITHWMKIESPN